MSQQHDIVTAQMSPDQRARMYSLANAVAETVMANGGNRDIRITTIALLRVLSACMARSEWGRAEKVQNEIASLLPLYVRAAVASNDGSRIIRPFRSLKVD